MGVGPAVKAAQEALRLGDVRGLGSSSEQEGEEMAAGGVSRAGRSCKGAAGWCFLGVYVGMGWADPGQ